MTLWFAVIHCDIIYIFWSY